MNKYTVVTGANGFMGSYLAERLIKKKFKIIKVDKESSNKNITKINLLNEKEIFKKLNNYNIERIIHFAAISDIDYSVNNPKKTINDNYLMTLNLLNYCKDKKIKSFDFASSIYTYSSQGSFYRISKILCEELIQEYSRLFKINFNILRYGSLIGLSLSDNNPINSMIRNALDNGVIYRTGFGNEIRKYIFIDDAIDLTIKCIYKNKKNNVFNITGNKNIKVISLLNKIKFQFKKIYNRDIKILFTKKSNLHHYLKTPKNKEIIKQQTYSPKNTDVYNKIKTLINEN